MKAECGQMVINLIIQVTFICDG